MCPCPVCATLALLLAPFLGYKWVKNLIKKHHCGCQRCQDAEREKNNTSACENETCDTKCACHGAVSCPMKQEQKVEEVVVSKRRAGRPKGAKNKVKTPVISEPAVQEKRRAGRPKGAKNKTKKQTIQKTVKSKRRVGRPKGAKNKPKQQNK